MLDKDFSLLFFFVFSVTTHKTINAAALSEGSLPAPVSTVTGWTNKTLHLSTDIKCSRYTGNVCDCLTAAMDCEYLTNENKCETSEKACSDVEILPNECFRGGALYTFGGAICDLTNVSATINIPECTIEETVLAVNLGGPGATDSSGIYHAEDTGVYSYPYRKPPSAEPVKDIHFANSAHPINNNIYSTFIRNKDRLGGNGYCVQFYFHPNLDGLYQLVAKVAEPKYRERNARHFHLDFDNKHYTVVIDPFRRNGGTHRGREMILNFMVEGNVTYYRIRGIKKFNSQSIIRNGKMSIVVCGSMCEETVTDASFAVSGISISRVKQVMPITSTNPPTPNATVTTPTSPTTSSTTTETITSTTKQPIVNIVKESILHQLFINCWTKRIQQFCEETTQKILSFFFCLK